MENTAATHMEDTGREPSPWPQRAVGALLALACLAGLGWTLLVHYAEYRFRAMAKKAESAPIDYQIGLEKLLKLDPTNGEIRNSLVTITSKQKSYNTAIEQLEIARRTLNMQDSLYLLGDLYEKQGDLKKAEQTMSDCVKINPYEPAFNAARLRLLNLRVQEMKARFKKGEKIDLAAYTAAMKDYGDATANWVIRAPFDMNSYYFWGNFSIEPLYALQAYRCYLIGFSRPTWMYINADKPPMIQPRDAKGTIDQILRGHYAKPYRGLPQ